MFDWLTQYQPQLLSVMRIMAGLVFLSHGTAKVFGFPSMKDVPHPGLSLRGLSGPFELVLGALLALGLFTSPAAFLASGYSAVGYWTVHAPRTFMPIKNGGETIVLYCFIWLYIAAAGPGAWAADNLIGRF